MTVTRNLESGLSFSNAFSSSSYSSNIRNAIKKLIFEKLELYSFLKCVGSQLQKPSGSRVCREWGFPFSQEYTTDTGNDVKLSTVEKSPHCGVRWSLQKQWIGYCVQVYLFYTNGGGRTL